MSDLKLLMSTFNEINDSLIIFLKDGMGNSLAVQWLGLCGLTANGPGSIPG